MTNLSHETRPPGRGLRLLGPLLLLAAVASWGQTGTPAEAPRLCWQRLSAAPPGAPRALLERAPDALVVTDGAHPVALLDPSGRRHRLTVTGDAPQLFFRWPDGELLHVWAHQGSTGVRRLTASVGTSAPQGCALPRSLAETMLTVEAIAEGAGAGRVCVAWDASAVPEPAAPGWRVSCSPLAVPNVVGLPFAKARRVLAEHGLEPGRLDRRAAADVPGVVVAQEPAAAAAAPLVTGMAVDLVLSASDRLLVPDLVGLGAAAARDRVAGLGAVETEAGEEARARLVLADAARLAEPRLRDYRIAAQRPAAGSEAAAPAVVEVELALRLSDLRGRTVAEAGRWLCERGLRLEPGGCPPAPDEAASAPADGEALVVDQQPGAGARVAEGATVTLASRFPGGAGATAVPDLIGRSPAAARRLLGELGLRLERPGRAAPDRPGERITAQEPGAGEPAPTPIVRVSVGVPVPAIEGEPVARAEALLAPLGLTLGLRPAGTAVTSWRRDAPRHRLAGQTPAPGSLVDPDDPSRSRVEAELEVPLPHLLWQPFGDVAAPVRRLGFELRASRPAGVTGAPCPPRRAAEGAVPADDAGLCVVSQSPAFAPDRYLPLGSPLLVVLGPGGVADPPPHDWLRFLIWSAVALLLAATLALRRLRPRGRRPRARGRVDPGTQIARPVPGAVAPPAVGLRPYHHLGPPTVRPRPPEKGQTDG